MIYCKMKDIELKDAVIETCNMQDTDTSEIDFSQCKRHVK
jgi:hypothetical protein